MNKIVRKVCLNPTVTLMEVEAPFVAKKAEPGDHSLSSAFVFIYAIMRLFIPNSCRHPPKHLRWRISPVPRRSARWRCWKNRRQGTRCRSV